MAVRDGQIFIQDFAGGLNMKDSPQSVRPNEAVECTNYIFSRTGEALVRRGYTLYGDVGTNAPIQGIYRFYRADASYLLVVSGGKVFVDSAEKATGFDPAAPFSFATWDWKNVCFLANGVDSLSVFNGSEVVSVANAPASPKHVAVYANRLWVAHVDGDPTLLRWSELGDYEEWPATNFAAAAGPITGLVPGYGQLYIFTPNRVEVLVGTGGATTTEGIHTLLEGVGCVAPRTIATHAGVTFFLGHEGVWQFVGGQVRLVSRNIEPAVTNLTPLQRNSAVGVIYDGRYWLSLLSGNKREVYIYDIQHGWWTKFTGIDATAFAVFDGAHDDNLLLSGDPSGRVWRQDSGETDNGEIIQATWKSKMFLPVPDWNCQFRGIALRTNRTYGEIEVGWSIDHGRVSGVFTWDRTGSESLWGSLIWGVDFWSSFKSSRFTDSFPMKAVGESVQFTIRQTGRGSLHNLTCRLRPKRKVI